MPTSPTSSNGKPAATPIARHAFCGLRRESQPLTKGARTQGACQIAIRPGTHPAGAPNDRLKAKPESITIELAAPTNTAPGQWSRQV